MPGKPSARRPAGFTDRAGALRDLAERALADAFRPGGPLGAGAAPERLVEAMRHATLGGGKRMRPVLCLATCQALCGEPEPALGAAVAVELLHAYTLVHDDLPCMDDDAVRRGLPTVHAKYGYAEAVLAGDALQAAAFRVLAEAAPPACALELAKAAGPAGVVGGQWVDVTAKPPHDTERILYVHKHKTADLVACACRMGAICAGAAPAAVDLAGRAGDAIGKAFQLVDDLLDASDPRKRDELSILRTDSPEAAKAAAEIQTELAKTALLALRPVPGLPACKARAAGAAADLLRDLAGAQLARTF